MINLDNSLQKIYELINAHVGSVGSIEHGIADEETAGFIAPQQTMTRTRIIGTQDNPIDVMVLPAGHYQINFTYNIWGDFTKSNPLGALATFDIYTDTSGSKIILAVEQYFNQIHFYNNYGNNGIDDRKTTDYLWTTVPQVYPLWSGQLNGVGNTVKLTGLYDDSLSTRLFQKVLVNYSYLGASETAICDLGQQNGIIIRHSNVNNDADGFNIVEFTSALNKDVLTITSNIEESIFPQTPSKSGEAVPASIQVTDNQLTLLSITGIQM